VRQYHLQLESNAAAAFPLMRRFGTIVIDLYPAGFRITTVWLRGFSRNPRTITIENPLSRTYIERPMSAIGDIIRFIGGRPIAAGPPSRVQVTSGNVGRLASRRHRLDYGSNGSVDVWTTTALGATAAFRSFADEFVRALSPRSVPVLRAIPGTPIYVELHGGRILPIVHPRKLVWSSRGEAEALRVSPWMFPAPFGTIFQ